MGKRPFNGYYVVIIYGHISALRFSHWPARPWPPRENRRFLFLPAPARAAHAAWAFANLFLVRPARSNRAPISLSQSPAAQSVRRAAMSLRLRTHALENPS